MAGRISNEVKDRIIKSRQHGLSFKEISMRFDKPIATCSAIWQKYRISKANMNIKSEDESDDQSVTKPPIKKQESEDEGEKEEEEEYVVEKIIEKRKRGGRTEYLIKWQGWGEDDNTWEPEEHLSCPDLVKEFEEKHKAKLERKRAKIKEKERERAEKFKAREKEREKEKNKDSEKSKDGDKPRDKFKSENSKDKERIKNRDQDGEKPNRKRKARVIDSSSGTSSPAAVENESSSSRFFPSDDDISSDNDEKAKLEERLKTLSNKKSVRDRTIEVENESSDDQMEDDNEDDDEVTGFDRGLEPKKIIGAIRIEDQLMFLIKWESCKKCDLILAEEANIRCPQVVISYYEKRLKWVPDFNSDLCD